MQISPKAALHFATRHPKDGLTSQGGAQRRADRLLAHVLQATPCSSEENGKQESGRRAEEKEEGAAGVIDGTSVRRLSGGQLLVEWTADYYCYHMRCYWGEEADKTAILTARKVLFVGWTDGAENLVVCDDPAPEAERLHFVLEDAATRTSSEVFTFVAPGKER
mmetsp:Transcript_102350/g.219053  ORF Transcript_102350/g.219053 Transcript_102350/m.219053 type:complete len:164 (-) Transcript_102350:78-569(-)